MFRPAFVVVASLVPVWIEADGLALQRANGDRERLRLWRRIDAQMRARRTRVQDHVGERAHAAHRAADEASQFGDPEAADGFVRRIGDVFQRELGKGQAVGGARIRIDRRGAGGALVAAERVDADDEIAVGVEGLAGADHVVPPARRRILGVGRGVGARRKAGEDQHRVAAVAVQRAPGFVRDACAMQFAAAFHAERRGERVVAACVAHGNVLQWISAMVPRVTSVARACRPGRSVRRRRVRRSNPGRASAGASSRSPMPRCIARAGTG